MTETAKYKPGDPVTVDTYAYGFQDGVIQKVQMMNGRTIYLVAGIYPPLRSESFWAWSHQVSARAYDQPPDTTADAAYYAALTEP